MSHSSLHSIQNINFLKAWNKPTCISGVPSDLSHSLLMQYYPHQHWSYTVSLFTCKVSFSGYLKRYSFIDLMLVSSYLFYFTLSWAICVILLHHKFSLFKKKVSITIYPPYILLYLNPTPITRLPSRIYLKIENCFPCWSFYTEISKLMSLSLWEYYVYMEYLGLPV